MGRACLSRNSALDSHGSALDANSSTELSGERACGTTCGCCYTPLTPRNQTEDILVQRRLAPCTDLDNGATDTAGDACVVQ